jgi:C4-type Zn-finger protein
MATATKKVSAADHLSCPGCRIRVRASAPEIDLLEGRCPICGATLRAVSSASGVMGFRSFDLDALSEQEPSGPPPTLAQPVDLVARREAAS